jgi:hypothetical protein
MKKLSSLQLNDKFIFNNKRYTITEQEGNMTEVFSNGKFWAWPSSANVKFIRE